LQNERSKNYTMRVSAVQKGHQPSTGEKCDVSGKNKRNQTTKKARGGYMEKKEKIPAPHQTVINLLLLERGGGGGRGWVKGETPRSISCCRFQHKRADASFGRVFSGGSERRLKGLREGGTGETEFGGLTRKKGIVVEDEYSSRREKTA